VVFLQCRAPKPSSCPCALLAVHRQSYLTNKSLHLHRAFTTLMTALLRTSLLWFGGAALFADLTTVSQS
jgi:hypothetical protein